MLMLQQQKNAIKIKRYSISFPFDQLDPKIVALNNNYRYCTIFYGKKSRDSQKEF